MAILAAAHLISCSAARERPPIATVDHGGRRGYWAIGRARGDRSAAQSNIDERYHRPAGDAAGHWPGPLRGTCNLAVWLSGCLAGLVVRLSIKICLACKAIEAVESQARQRTRHPKGAGVEAHARAGMWQRHRANLHVGFAGKGGPWSPGKEIEGPLALGARSLAAVLLAALEVLEALQRRCEELLQRLGKPAWGICGARRLLSYEVRPTQCRDGRKP